CVATSFPAPCGSRRRPPSGSPSSSSIPRPGGPSPIGSLPRRSAVARRSGLGRGLGALIPTELVGGSTELLEIPLSDVEPNPHQPRVTFDEETLAGLAASIIEMGVLQPVLVRPLEGG